MSMLNFPDWSDLSGVASQTRNYWEGEAAIREKYESYYSGDVFAVERVPVEGEAWEDQPELYPVGINLVKMMCLAQADALFGEWDEEIISFEPQQDAQVEQPEKAGSQLARDILNRSDAQTLLWQLALDGNKYGGAPIKIYPSFTGHPYIKWSRVPLPSFFPIWDPDDLDELLEVYIVIKMTRDQAKAKWGYDGDKEEVYRIEHWTKRSYENKLDGVRMGAYSGQNPWGIIPFEYFPRMRSRIFWGDSLTEDLIRVQDELNMRVADLGEAINYNTHPIKWGLNMPRSFNSGNYEVGPNSLWDLGRQMGPAALKPEVGILEAKNPIPQGTWDHVEFLYNWSQFSTFTPPVALGQDSGGNQRSGITLEVRMLPLIRATRRSRSFMSGSLKRAMRKTAIMFRQREFRDIPVKAVDRLYDSELLPKFAPLMPRDMAQIVDQVVKRLSTTPPTISLETAVKMQGQGTSEVERIRTDLRDDELYSRANVNQNQNAPGMNSGAGNAP